MSYSIVSRFFFLPWHSSRSKANRLSWASETFLGRLRKLFSLNILSPHLTVKRIQSFFIRASIREKRKDKINVLLYKKQLSGNSKTGKKGNASDIPLRLSHSGRSKRSKSNMLYIFYYLSEEVVKKIKVKLKSSC